MLEDSNDSTNFSVRHSLPLIRQDSVTHRHNLAVYVMAILLFASGPSLENPDDSFELVLLHSVIMTFLSINCHTVLCEQFLILFHQSYCFSQSIPFLMYLFL